MMFGRKTVSQTISALRTENMQLQEYITRNQASTPDELEVERLQAENKQLMARAVETMMRRMAAK